MKGAFRTAGRVTGAFVLAAALGACAHWPFHGGAGGPVQEATLTELLDRVGERTSGLSSLKALVSVEARGGRAFLASVAWAKPDALRVVGLSPVGSTLFELTVEGGIVRWAEPGRMQEVLGPVETLGERDGTMRRELPMPVEDMIFLLRALTGPALEKGEVPFLERRDPFYIVHVGRIEGDRGRLTERIFIDGRSLRIDRETLIRADGTSGVRLRFGDYRATDHGIWPHRIVADVPRNGLKIAFVIQELRFNPPVTTEDFPLPAGGAP